MRGEFHAKHGRKLSMLRKLITPHLDFLILTETKAHPSALTRIKLRYGMKISHHSSHQQARKRVIIIAKPEHMIMEGSLRESGEPGHIVAAVYKVNKSRTVVIGVYGISENNDRSSADLIQEISNIARELKHLYNSQHVIVAGDFNAVLSPEDSNDHQIRKTRTTGKLHLLLEQHDLTDLATAANKHSHTWNRRNSDQSSRIDMIFSSIPMNNLRFETTFTTFDHLFINATFGQVHPRVEPTMKDHILGSDEYLIRAQDTILQHLERFGNGPLQPLEDIEPGHEPDESYKHTDENLAVHDIHNGRTTLHVFNSIIKELQGIHNEISKEKINKQRSEVRRIWHQLFQLKRTRKRV